MLVAVVTGTAPVHAQWPQWGGPDRSFRTDMSGVADTWPPDGPRVIWKEALGDGYTSVVVDHGHLYTAYRPTPASDEGGVAPETGEEVVVALDADTGRTLWSHKIPSPVRRVGELAFGPNSTILIVNDKLYFTSAYATLHCLDKQSGKRLWERHLGGTQNAPMPDGYGYTCSPIAIGDHVIVTADFDAVRRLRASDSEPAAPATSSGAEKPHTLAAFHKNTGEVAWTGGRFNMGHASPIEITFRGQRQLVLFTMDGLYGIDPADGAVLWHYPVKHENPNDAIMTPRWDGTEILVFSSHGNDSGSRAVQLVKRGGKTEVKELWHSQKVFFGMHAPALSGGTLIGANDRLMLGVDMKTGKRLWRQRGFRQGACVYGDDRMLFLSMDGQLTLADLSADGITIRSQFQVVRQNTFTPPTLVGTRLYVRDRQHIMAFDVGGQEKAPAP